MLHNVFNFHTDYPYNHNQKIYYTKHYPYSVNNNIKQYCTLDNYNYTNNNRNYCSVLNNSESMSIDQPTSLLVHANYRSPNELLFRNVERIKVAKDSVQSPKNTIAPNTSNISYFINLYSNMRSQSQLCSFITNFNRKYVRLKPKSNYNELSFLNSATKQSTSVEGKPSLERALMRKNITELEALGTVKGSWGDALALYDTGATIDVMNSTFAQKYFKDKIQSKPAIKVETANKFRKLSKYVEDDILIGYRMCRARFYLIDDISYDIIVGRNTLNKLGYRLIQVDTEGNPNYSKYTHYADLSHMELPNNDPWYERIAYPIQDIRSDYSQVESRNVLQKTFIGDIPDNALSTLRDMLSKLPTAQHEVDAGTIPNYCADITLQEGAQPYAIKQPYRMHPSLADEAQRQIELLVQAGWIKKSKSPWAAGITFAQKKTGGLRMCMDYRPLNLRIIDHRGNMPDINTLFTQFKGKKRISTLDLKSGYWHIKLNPKHTHLTAFLTPWGLYEWTRLPFGIKTAPLIFQAVMREIFKDMDFVLVYLDDICILSDNLKQHMKHLKLVFKRIQQYNLKLRLDKCQFCVSEINYLGYTINATHYKPTRKYTTKVLNCPVPKSKKELQSFLGMVQWIKRFMPPFEQYSSVLYELTHKHVKWRWGEVHQKSFDRIQNMIRNIQHLHVPDITKPFYIETDASYHALGAVLLQKVNGTLAPVEWCSKSFDKTQINWDIGEKECYAVIHAVEKWKHFLYQHFTIFTDHKNLATLFNYARTFRGNKLWRWALRLQEFSFTVTARPGTEQVLSDYLSRYIITNDDKPHQPKVIVYSDKDTIHSICFDPNILQNYELKAKLATETYCGPTVSPQLTHEYPYQLKYINTPFVSNVNIPEVHNNSKNYIISLATYLAINYRDNPIQIYNSEQTHSVSDNMYHILNNNVDSQTPHLYTLNSNIHIIPMKPNVNNSSISGNTLFVAKTRSYYRNLAQKSNKNNQRQYIETDIATSSDEDIDIQTESQDEVKENEQETFIDSEEQSFDELYSWAKSNYNCQDYIPTIESLKEAQLNDPICYNIKQWIESGQESNNIYFTDLPIAHQNVFNVAKHNLHIKNGIIYYKNQIYCPSSLRFPLLQYIHNSYLHIKFQKMKQLVSQYYWWPYMNADISAVIESCEPCYRCDNTRDHRSQKMTLFAATRVFQYIHIDIVGPFNETENGHKYILTMCDRLSRYLIMTPIKDIKALTVTQAFLTHWVCVFGIPDCVISDQGTQFESTIFQHLMKILNIKKQRTTAYRPQSNGRVERLHREIKKRLRKLATQYGLKFVNKTNDFFVDDWAQFLPIIQFTLNSIPTRATGFAPIQMVLGFQPRFPGNPVWTVDNGQAKPKTFKEYVQWLQGVKSTIIDKSLINQAKYNERRKRYFDATIKPGPTYKIGDIVRYYDPLASSLESKWSDPYTIIEYVNNNPCVVRICNPNDSNETLTMNIDRLCIAHPHVSNSQNNNNNNDQLNSNINHSIPPLENIH